MTSGSYDGCEYSQPDSTTLLKKYDVPVSFLSYEHVEVCTNIKELEHILKILRSGEEGTFPHLINFTETRLRSLHPESRALRTKDNVLMPSVLEHTEWFHVKKDIQDWTEDVKAIDADLTSDRKQAELEINMIPIRETVNLAEGHIKKQQKSSVSKSTPTVKSVVPRSYADWDKFDPEEEILKIETKEERLREVKEIEKKTQKRNQEEMKLNTLKCAVQQDVLPSERQAVALKEKTKGNECFKANDYVGALCYFSNSLQLHPTISAINNRALTYFRLSSYDACIRDCGLALDMEPDNVKALFRRASAYKCQNLDPEAVADLVKIQGMDPNNRAAKKALQELSEKMLKQSLAKSSRIQITDISETSIPSSENNPEQPKSSKIDVSPKYKINKWGLAETMCECNGVPPWVHQRSDKSKITQPKSNPKITEIHDSPKVEEVKNSPKITEVKSSPKITEIINNPKIVEIKNNPKITEVNINSKITEIENNPEITEIKNNPEIAEIKNNPKIPDIINNSMETKKGSLSNVAKFNNKVKKANNSKLKLSEVTDPAEVAALMAKSTISVESKMPQLKSTISKTIFQKIEIEKMDIATEIHQTRLCNDTDDARLSELSGVAEMLKDSKPLVVKGETVLVPNELSSNIKEPVSQGFKQLLVKQKSVEYGAGDNFDNMNEEHRSSGMFFLHEWCTIKDDDTLLHHAKLLNSIKPEDLPKSIGAALDQVMFSMIITCLHEHAYLFSPDMRLDYLINITRLERFNIIVLFIDREERIVLGKIFQLLFEQGVTIPPGLRDTFSCQ